MRNGYDDDLLRPETDWQVCGYHVPPPSVDTGHLPNLFIKDAIIKRSATNIVLSEEDRSIWSIYLPMVWLNWLQPRARYMYWEEPNLIWVSSIIR